MKVIIVTGAIDGGAGKAVYRLHKAFLERNIDSRVLVHRKNDDDYTVIGPITKAQRLVAALRTFLDKIVVQHYKPTTRFSPFWVPFSNFAKKINELNPDVVHLNWMGDGMIRIEDLNKIKAPIVWTLHDMWVFSGGCHYAGDCKKYVSGCFQCPVIGSKKKNDISKRILNRKLRHWKNLDIRFVSPSKWLANCARESLLLKNSLIKIIPYNIDTHIYKPIEKNVARAIMNLPADKSILLWGAFAGIRDKRKGIKYLLAALEKIPIEKRENMVLVIFGSTRPEHPIIENFKVIFMGPLMDDQSLALMYSCADVFLAPSIEDNLPLTVMESLACGTPVVAFNIGGLPDMIEHKINGYLAIPFEPDDLGAGIKWVLEDVDRRDALGKAARNKVLMNYTADNIVEEYEKIYNTVIKNK